MRPSNLVLALSALLNGLEDNMRELVYDSRGKLPRFVVFKDAVVNQYTGDEVAYVGEWFDAYLELYLKYKKEGL